ncbi:MAG: protein kinase [Polyangiaceae bacterium]|nr:protein kinase [Polyangiaceae bacterium]
MVILEEGVLIGRYRVRSLIFRSSLFDAYSATDDRGVAVCALRREHAGRSLPTDSEFNAVLEMLRNLRTDHFPRVLEGGRDAQSAWLITEAIGGTTPIWTRGADPVHWLRALMTLGQSTADSFEKAAAVGVFHGALTPDCLRKWPNGAACIIGIGAARFFGMDADTVRSFPRYCAPEQFQDSPIPTSDRTDVYALGMCLYALITGHEPFGDAEEQTSLAQYGSPDFTLLRGIPDKVEDILSRCCAKSAADRHGWADYAELVHITVKMCSTEVSDSKRMEIMLDKISELGPDTMGKLLNRLSTKAESDSKSDKSESEQDGDSGSENSDEVTDALESTDRSPTAVDNASRPLIVPIAAPVLIASLPSNEARPPSTDRVPMHPANPPIKPPQSLPPIAPPPKGKKSWARTMGAFAMLGGVGIALALAIMSNQRPPVAWAPAPPSERQEVLEDVARLLSQARAPCERLPSNSAEPDRPVAEPAPMRPRRDDGDTLKNSCGKWFNCDRIPEEINQ